MPRVPPPLRGLRALQLQGRRQRESRRRYHEQNGIDPSLAARLRMAVRIPLLIGALLWVYLVWIACRPLGWVSGSDLRWLRRRLLRWWGSATLWVLNARVERRGAAPQPPFFLVANHLSYVDIIILAQQTGCVFIAMAEMAAWPLIGFMMRTSQQLFIDRDEVRDTARVLARIHEVIDAGDCVNVFAEARCSRGLTVLPFRPALLEAAAVRSIPVHYAVLSYRTPPGSPAASDAVAWWRWEGPGAHLNRLLRLPGFTIAIEWCAAPVRSTNRKILARDLHEAVRARFKPLRQGMLPELPAPAALPKVYRDTPA